jgi:hypothetical protein
MLIICPDVADDAFLVEDLPSVLVNDPPFFDEDDNDA